MKISRGFTVMNINDSSVAAVTTRPDLPEEAIPPPPTTNHHTAQRLACAAALTALFSNISQTKGSERSFPLAIFQSRMFSFLASRMNMYVLACSARNMCVCAQNCRGLARYDLLPAVETGRFTLFRYAAVARARGREAHGCFHGPCLWSC